MARDVNPLGRSPVHLLHRAGQCAKHFFGTAVGGDLTPRQLAVLAAVADNEGGTQTDIVETTWIDRSTLADIVRRLQRKGLLHRRRTKEDARAYAVKLTDRGRRLLRSAQSLRRPWTSACLMPCPPSSVSNSSMPYRGSSPHCSAWRARKVHDTDASIRLAPPLQALRPADPHEVPALQRREQSVGQCKGR